MSDVVKGIRECLETINKLREENAAQAAEIMRLRADRNAEISARMKAEGEFSTMQRRIARQRRALSKMYKHRHDKNAEITRLRAALATARQDVLAEIKQDTDELIEQGRQDGMEQAAQIGDRHIEVGKVLAETEANKRLADNVKMQVGAMQQVVDAIRAAAQEVKP